MYFWLFYIRYFRKRLFFFFFEIINSTLELFLNSYNINNHQNIVYAQKKRRMIIKVFVPL